MNKTSGVHEWNIIAHYEAETKNAAWRHTGCRYQPEMTDIIQLSPEGEVNILYNYASKRRWIVGKDTETRSVEVYIWDIPSYGSR